MRAARCVNFCLCGSFIFLVSLSACSDPAIVDEGDAFTSAPAQDAGVMNESQADSGGYATPIMLSLSHPR